MSEEIVDDSFEITLKQCGIEGRIMTRASGPSMEHLFVKLAPGAAIKKVTAKLQDISFHLSLPSLTITPEVSMGLLRFSYLKDLRVYPRLLDMTTKGEGMNLPFIAGVDMLGNIVTKDLSKTPNTLIGGATGCLHGEVVIYDPVSKQSKTARERWKSGEGFHVWSQDAAGNPIVTAALPVQRFSPVQMVKVTLSNGESIEVTLQHKFLTTAGWKTASWISERLQFESVLLPTSSGTYLSTHAEDALHWSKTVPGSLDDYRPVLRSCGEQPLDPSNIDPSLSPLLSGAPSCTLAHLHKDDLVLLSGCIPICLPYDPLSKSSSFPSETLYLSIEYPLPLEHPVYADLLFSCDGEPQVQTCQFDTNEQPPLLSLVSTIHSASATCPPFSTQQSFPHSPGDPLQYPVRSCLLGSIDEPALFQPRPEQAVSYAGTRCSSAALPKTNSTLTGPKSLPPKPLDPTDYDLVPNLPYLTSCCLEPTPKIEDTLGVVKVVYIELTEVAAYYDFHVPVTNNYWVSGVWNHNCGKSVLLHSILCSLIRSLPPEQLKLVIVDPKQGAEFGCYSDLRHHYDRSGLITDPMHLCDVMHALVRLSKQRYTDFAVRKVSNLQEYNRSVGRARALPHIVVVVDELADLMGEYRAALSPLIQCLAQKSRAAGIHLILATQRPSVKVITGDIKANCPTRIALRVQTGTDSRVVLDRNGAENLMGNGDMLYSSGTNIERLQAPFMSQDDISSVVSDVLDNKYVSNQ